MGNRLGWIIAGLLTLVIVGVFLAVAVFPQPTPPSNRITSPGALDQVELKADPAVILGWSPSGGENAGAYFAQAVRKCKAGRPAIQDLLAKAPSLANGKETLTDAQSAMLKEIAEAVHAGAQQASMRYVFEFTPKVVEVGAGMPEAGELQDVLNALLLYSASLIGQKDYLPAERVYQDTLMMGYDLTRERARVWTVKMGLGLQSAACGRLEALYNKYMPERKTRLADLSAYRLALSDLTRSYEDKLAMLHQFRSVKENPGDVFNMAENDKDRAWRVEAIATLGVVKFIAPGRGDKRYAKKLIDRYLSSSDPLEAAAAKAANDLTIEQYRTLGSRPGIANCELQIAD